MGLLLRNSNHICCAPSSFQPTNAITVVRIMYHHSVLEWRFWDNNDYTKPSITGYNESILLPSFLTLSILAPSPRDCASYQLNFFLSIIWQRTFPGYCTYRVWFIAQFTAHFSTWGRRRGIILQWKSWKPKKNCYFLIQRVVPVTRCSYDCYRIIFRWHTVQRDEFRELFLPLTAQTMISSSMWNKKPTRCHLVLYLFLHIEQLIRRNKYSTKWHLVGFLFHIQPMASCSTKLRHLSNKTARRGP